MQTTNEKEQLTRISIPVVGMTCASCVRRVERTLSERKVLSRRASTSPPRSERLRPGARRHGR